jgi:uncharacterized protein DUF4290
MTDYNTTRSPLILKEYGRNVQKLTEYIKTLESREERTKFATTLISLMKQLTPNYKQTAEETQKIWDDLFIMANFDLDIESPYPVPDETVLTKKPDPIGYKQSNLKFRHYGRNIQIMIEKTIEMEDPKVKESAVIYIGKLMRTFHASWNKDLVDEGVILENIKTMSNNQLDLDLEKVKEQNLFAPIYKERTRESVNSGHRKRGKDRKRSGPSHSGKRRKN